MTWRLSFGTLPAKKGTASWFPLTIDLARLRFWSWAQTKPSAWKGPGTGWMRSSPWQTSLLRSLQFWTKPIWQTGRSKETWLNSFVLIIKSASLKPAPKRGRESTNYFKLSANSEFCKKIQKKKCGKSKKTSKKTKSAAENLKMNSNSFWF
jgi:hypothetical protein